MTAVVDSIPAKTRACLSQRSARSVRVALLGVGQVGSAVAALVTDSSLSARFMIVSGLVRNLDRDRPHARHLRLISRVHDALEGNPDVVIEALGGLEPARTLVLEALSRGIPVVTANKSLLAAHGEELLERAARAAVPLRYEAAVLAGVPFLHTFSGRSLARDVSALYGIVNGTTNFIISSMADQGTDFASALAEAQRLGYAEPDPANDVTGVDAVEKLCVLLRHFGDWQVRPSDVDVEGITRVEAGDIRAAARLGGRIRPVIHADWSTGTLNAFCGPALLPGSSSLAPVNGVQNAILLRNRRLGDLFFAGPGAGPEVTAATLLDDASEALTTTASASSQESKRATPSPPATGWFVRLSIGRAPDEGAIVRLLQAHDVYVKRTLDGTSDAPNERCVLTYPCERARIAAALGTFRSVENCEASAIRAVEC